MADEEERTDPRVGGSFAPHVFFLRGPPKQVISRRRNGGADDISLRRSRLALSPTSQASAWHPQLQVVCESNTPHSPRGAEGVGSSKNSFLVFSIDQIFCACVVKTLVTFAPSWLCGGHNVSGVSMAS